MKNVELFERVGKSWPCYVSSVRTRSHLHPDIKQLDHPAAQFLDSLRSHGVPVHMKDEPWTPDLILERAERGSHQSTTAHKDFVRDEMADFDEKSFWTVLPLEILLHLPNLRLSPLGCIPQRNR